MMLWRALRGWAGKRRPRFRRDSDRSDGICHLAGALATELLVAGLDGCGLQAEQRSDGEGSPDAPAGLLQELNRIRQQVHAASFVRRPRGCSRGRQSPGTM